MNAFHLAIPVTDLEHTRSFYGDLLGCAEGRTSPTWIDWNFFGHQLTTHLVKQPTVTQDVSLVDGKEVPCRHFGMVLPWDQWHSLKETLVNHGIDFIIKPYIRFQGEIGEQATMFLSDPSGNVLEFKSFRDMSQLFAPYPSPETQYV